MMNALHFLFLIAWTSAAADEVFRVSRVVDAAGEGIDRMTFKAADHEEVLFVKKEAVVSAADVQEAWAEIFPSMRHISIRLKPEGGKKMEVVTGEMKLGVERLAIVVDGKPNCAPVVQAKLGAQFIVQGFDDLTDDQLKELARKIAGRPPGVPSAEMPEMKRPEQKWEPYTEEEYQQIKASREKMGISYLDKIPSEEELSSSLRNGMSVAEVVKVLGNPFLGSKDLGPGRTELRYMIAPEKRVESPDGRAVEDGFSVHLKDGKVSGWSHSYSNFPRELKRVGREAPSLKMTAPEMKGPIEDFDLLDYFEKLEVAEPRQKVNQTDLEDLVALASMLVGVLDQKNPEKTSIRADCDLIETMAIHFPEVGALRKDASGGKIGVSALKDAVDPYIFGRKSLPVAGPKTE